MLLFEILLLLLSIGLILGDLSKCLTGRTPVSFTFNFVFWPVQDSKFLGDDENELYRLFNRVTADLAVTEMFYSIDEIRWTSLGCWTNLSPTLPLSDHTIGAEAISNEWRKSINRGSDYYTSPYGVSILQEIIQQKAVASIDNNIHVIILVAGDVVTRDLKSFDPYASTAPIDLGRRSPNDYAPNYCFRDYNATLIPEAAHQANLKIVIVQSITSEAQWPVSQLHRPDLGVAVTYAKSSSRHLNLGYAILMGLKEILCTHQADLEIATMRRFS